MSDNLIQTSFAAGELAPSIFARTDLSKYHAGAAVMRNFFVDYRSGASTRAGTRFITQALISSTAVRLIPYQFSSTVGYIIEFGDKYCRFITNTGMVLETGYAISGASLTSPATTTVVGNNFVNGDIVYISGMTGSVQFNSLFYKVTVSGSIVTLFDVNGVAFDATSFSTYITGGTISRVYTIVSPYSAADLALLKFAQSASTMTLTHPSYVPYTLTSSGPTSWAFAAITFGASVTAPTGLGSSATTGTGAYYKYAVSAVDVNGQESTATTLAVDNVVNLGTTAGTITISWAAVLGAVSYNIYKSEVSLAATVPAGVILGFIGSATAVSFIDSNIVPDFTVSPQIVNNPFTSNNPNTFCYFQQRSVYAGSNSAPTTFWMSQPGSFNNFNTTNPVQDDNSIVGTIVSLQVNAIKNMIPMPGGLIMLTSKGAWQVSGGGGGVGSTSPITPADATAVPQAYNGASDVPPIVVNYDIVYVQAKGAIIRDLAYNIYANIYTGTDISILSNHLFLNYQIKEWAYAEEPFKIIWAIRDDGALLSLTFVKEQEIYGWAQHDTEGLFQSVASITEGQVDAIYVVVKRQLDFGWVQTIERMDNRQFTVGNYNPTNSTTLPIPMYRGNAESAWCVDCGAQTALFYPAATLTADTITGSVIFMADSVVFDGTTYGVVGQVIRMCGGIATITGRTSSTIVTGTWTVSPSRIVPNSTPVVPQPTVTGSWSIANPVTTIYSLDYLEGKTVSILADGNVLAEQVVTNGKITLSNPASLVTVGLPFRAQLQTMPLDVAGGETAQGKRKKIAALTIRGANSRGLEAGRTFATLVPLKEWNSNVLIDAPIPLVTGDERVVVDPLWDVPGQICIQQEDPLPATVLGVIPEIVIGDTK